MAFAIEAEVSDPRAETFAFTAQKTMYGGKHIAAGDTVFVFTENGQIRANRMGCAPPRRISRPTASSRSSPSPIVRKWLPAIAPALQAKRVTP